MAELKLKVSLDTSYLKGQISRLPLEFAGANVSIRPKFDRQTIVNEFRLLNRYISSKKFNIVIATNLNAEIENAERLVKALGRVQQAASGAKGGLPIGTKQLSLTGQKGGFTAAEIKTLFGAAIQGGLLDEKTLGKKRDQMVAALGSIGRDSIAGLLNGLKSGDADIQKAAQMLGGNLIKTTKEVLGIASPSKEFEKIGKNVGKGFENGTLSSMDSAFDALESKMRQRGKILDTVARGIFKMLGMDPASMLQQAREQRAMPARPSIAGLLPSSTAKGNLQRLGAASSKPTVDQGPGRLALSNEALGRRVSAILEEYFKVAEVQVRESFNPRELKQSLNVFSFIAQSLRDAETRTRQARIAESVDALMKAIDDSIKVAQAKVRISSVQVSELRPRAQAVLPAGRVAGFLPGRPSRASILELNNILAGAIREYFKAVARDVGRVGKAPLSATPLLPSASAQNPPLLPPIGGTSGSIRISTGAFVGQPDFRQAPSIPAATRQPLTGQSTPLASPLGSGYFAVGKGLKDIQSAYGQAKKFLDTKKFPVAGAITELGSEFGSAIKQVLLFGTAYKALAFLTSLPGEAFNAAKGLATYKNQLQAVTAATGTFDQSLAFVDNLANRFNVPLASAREGFVKLFASMQPAGFDQGQVENLFTGISKAAAAFGLSADTVDRVNVAFAQMASKGQIMAEEVKGQLGDALPGALSLFAEAAQMSLAEFSKAMEDGAFKGKAMEQVLDNVGILLNTKFGAAASGAAKTLQGAVNQIQNNLKLMHESFGPIVDAAAAAFGPEINSLIKDVTETMKVLAGTFTQTGEGFDTLSPRAQAFYAAIQTLRPSLEQAGAALVDLGGRLASLLPLFIQVISAAISLASSPLARGAIVAATAIGILTAALKLLEVTGLKAALKAVYAFIGGLLKIPPASGAARLGIISLKLALTGLFVGAIFLGLDFLIGKLFNIGDAANDSAKDIRGMRNELDAMAGAGDIGGIAQVLLDAETNLAATRKANQAALNDLKKAKARPEGDTQADIDKGVAVANAQRKVNETFEKVITAQKDVTAARQSRASAVAAQERQEEQAQKELQKIDLSAGDGAAAGKAAKELDTYNRSALDFIKQDAEQQKLGLERRLQASLISETQFKLSIAQLDLSTAEAEQAELLRLARLSIAKENLSAQDKVLKLKDAEISKENEIAIARDKHFVAVEGARKELEGPFNDAIDNANFAMIEQQMLLENLKGGIEGLAPEQQAYLQVLGLTKGKSEDELAILEKRGMEMQDAIEREIALSREVERGNILLGLRNQLTLARTLDPGLKLREQIRQRNPDETFDRIEQEALLQEQVNAAQKTEEQLQGIASSIGNSFGEAFKGIITGSMTVQQALAGMFQSIADSFADMVAQMIAEFLKAQLIKGFLSLFPSFGGGGLGSSAANVAQYAPLTFANGGIASGSFQAFANGGMVTGPTLGLVGEGRYNEAIIPLPDGKSVPVQLSGGAGGNAAPINTSIVVNVKNGQAESQMSGNQGNQLARELEGAVRQVILKESRPGGLISSSR